MGSQIHNIDYRIKGAIEHKQDAIEIHFIMGALVLTFLLLRLFWSKFYLPQSRKPQFTSSRHKSVVYIIHSLMYIILLLLIVTGIFMVTNYEQPLNILSLVTFSQGQTEARIFNQANEIHLYLESAIYFLIAIHFAGAMYSRR
jgi:cytochrome b561